MRRLAAAAAALTLSSLLVGLSNQGLSVELLQPAAGGGGALAQRIARLEAESKQIEQVRLRAARLDRQIADLERRGNSAAGDQGALAAEAARLKGHLTTLARDAHLDPAQVLRDYPSAAVGTGADAKAPAPRHRYIDDDSRTWSKTAREHHYIDDDSREVERRVRAQGKVNVGVLGRTPETKAARGRHHYIDDSSWEAAPKLNKWGEEQLGKAGAKTASIGFYNYGNPTKLRPWQYGPKESAFGADFERGVKGQKDISFGNSWSKVVADDSWKLAPKGDSLLGEVKGVGSTSVARESAAKPPADKTPAGGLETPAESKAWSKAEKWFNEMRAKTARQVEAENTHEEEVKREVRRQVEARVHHFSRFDRSVTARVAGDLKMLQEARAAEAALRKSRGARGSGARPEKKPPRRLTPATAAVQKQLSRVRKAARDSQAPAQPASERDGALSRTERMLDSMVASAGSKYGAAETPLVTAEEREQAGWQHAAHQAAVAEPRPTMTPSAVTKMAARQWGAGAGTEVDYRQEAEAMQVELRKARALVAKLPASERGAAQGAIKAMEGTLKGAKVTAATLERNAERERAMSKAADAAAAKVSSLETDPVVQKAEAAQERVWRLQQQLEAAKSGQDERALLHTSGDSLEIHKHVLAEAAAAAARGTVSQAGRAPKAPASASTSASRLAKLGINTGEGVWGDDWGGDQVAPVDRQ